MLPGWEALILTLSSPPPFLVLPRPQTNHPLDFCGRHIMSAAFHPKLPDSLFSAHVAPPRMGIFPEKGLGVTQTSLGQKH